MSERTVKWHNGIGGTKFAYVNNRKVTQLNIGLVLVEELDEDQMPCGYVGEPFRDVESALVAARLA